MHVMRQAEAPRYFSPGHEKMSMQRLQGREAGPADTVWIGLSVLEPGGGTTLDASPMEKFYVVLDGEITFTSRSGDADTALSQTAVLRPNDSCRIAPGESRQLFNAGTVPARVVLVMALAPSKPVS